MKSAVLLLSSGLDSAANLALGDFTVKVALTVDYGQRGAAREKAQAKALAGHFGVEHVVFDLSAFVGLARGGSALLGAGAVPEVAGGSLDDLDVTRESAKAVWVPNRNGVLLNLGAAFAEARGLQAVAVGFNAEEAVTFPDNTPEYLEAATKSFGFSTANGVQAISATAALTKREIVERVAEGGFPFHLLWSCYHGGEKHCGRCESCNRLKRALSDGLQGPKRAQALAACFGGEAATC